MITLFVWCIANGLFFRFNASIITEETFMDECPYDVDGNTIECECVGEE